MTSTYSYWKNVSIPYEQPRFPFGTEKNWVSLKEPLGEHYKNVYMKFKSEKVVGMFQLRDPYLLVRDPELLKQILTKDFHHFIDRGMIDPSILPPISRQLFNMQGESWKIMRNKLAPAFTSREMKTIYFLMEVCSNEFVKALELIAERNGKVDIKDYIARFTTDVIASYVFGLQSDSIKNPDNEFRRNGNKFFEAPPKYMIILVMFAMIFPWVIKKLRIKLFTNGSEDYFLKLIGDTVAYREKHNVIRKDFIDVMIKIKNNKCLVEDEINDDNGNEQKLLANGEPGEFDKSFNYFSIPSQ